LEFVLAFTERLEDVDDEDEDDVVGDFSRRARIVEMAGSGSAIFR